MRRGTILPTKIGKSMGICGFVSAVGRWHALRLPWRHAAHRNRVGITPDRPVPFARYESFAASGRAPFSLILRSLK